MDDNRSNLAASWEREQNPFAASQVAQPETRQLDEVFRLVRPIPLAGRGSLETMERAVWKTYGRKHSLRFALFVLAGSTGAAYCLFHGQWVWGAALSAAVAVLLYSGLYTPWRILRYVRRSAADFDMLFRGQVTDEALELQEQAADGAWVSSFPDEPAIAWTHLRLVGLGDDFLLFIRRKEKLAWLLSLPRQLFASERDWRDMVEFAERRLMHGLLAPHCTKCRRRFSRSELEPLPLGLRMVIGQPFSSFGLLLGIPPARYCANCWTSVYMRQLNVAITLTVVLLMLVAGIAYLVWD